MGNKENYELLINGILFNTDNPLITGSGLLTLIDVTDFDEYEVLFKIREREYEPVELDQQIDLRKPDIECFHVRPYNHFKIEIDDDRKEVLETFLTPKGILALVGYSESDYYLKQIIGHKDITYKDNPNHRIAMKNGMKFTTCKIAPTPVS